MKKLVILFLLMSFSVFSIQTRKAIPIKEKAVPKNYNYAGNILDPFFIRKGHYTLFFPNHADIEDTAGYLPIMLNNELLIISISDTKLVARIRFTPYKVSDRNNLYLISRNIIDDDEYFEVIECFYFEVGEQLWFRVIDHTGEQLCVSKGLPSFYNFRGERRISIFTKEKVASYYQKDIIRKKLITRRYLKLNDLFNDMIYNILYKSKYKPKLKIKTIGKRIIYTFKYQKNIYQSQQFNKLSSFDQVK